MKQAELVIQLNLFSLKYQENIIEFLIQDLMSEEDNDIIQGNFKLNLTQDEGSEITMGMPFFEKHYVLFDFDAQTISLKESIEGETHRIMTSLSQFKLFQFLFVILLSLAITHIIMVGFKSYFEMNPHLDYMNLEFI